MLIASATNSNEILYLVLLGFWAPLVLIVVPIYVLVVRRQSFQTYELERRRTYELDAQARATTERDQEELRYVLDSATRRIADQVAELRSTIPLLTEELPDQVAARVTSRFTTQLGNEIDALRTALVASSPGITAPISSDGADQRALLRELSHSLNTPLSQIDARADALEAALSQDTDVTTAATGLLADLHVSVAICRSFLGAFRRLADIRDVSDEWADASLEEATRAAATVYDPRDGEALRVGIELPSEIPGYTTSYVLAVLLPLLENALEAAPDGTDVHITHSNEDSLELISISNDSQQAPDCADMLESGFTTKANHDGIGLSSAQRLLTSAGGALKCRRENDNITMVISLPSKR
jgi:signal transduction histidine kinase